MPDPEPLQCFSTLEQAQSATIRMHDENPDRILGPITYIECSPEKDGVS